VVDSQTAAHAYSTLQVGVSPWVVNVTVQMVQDLEAVVPVSAVAIAEPRTAEITGKLSPFVRRQLLFPVDDN